MDREAHEWWYHGLVTLRHNTITSYPNFTQRLVEWFYQKDSEVHFRELTQLKQTGSAVMVTDISESRLIMLFTEALTEPLRGWVKSL